MLRTTDIDIAVTPTAFTPDDTDASHMEGLTDVANARFKKPSSHAVDHGCSIYNSCGVCTFNGVKIYVQIRTTPLFSFDVQHRTTVNSNSVKFILKDARRKKTVSKDMIGYNSMVFGGNVNM